MAQDMKVLVMHNNQDVLRDISVILEFLGEAVLSSSLSDWRTVVEQGGIEPEQLSVVFLGADEAPVEQIVKELHEWDEGVPVLGLGEASLDGLDDIVRRKVIAQLDCPLNYNKTLDSLYRAQVYREQYSVQTGRGKQRQVELFRSLVGTSRGVQDVRGLMSQVADKDVSVLITGQSGTGKEVVARNLHYNSHRRNKPFVPVNCGAIPAELLESELFGHEKGAFTGAITARAGRFELAEGGTLFLDEIGDMPLDLQPKLLRALQENEIERVGKNQLISVDVRIVVATNVNLLAMVQQKKFRNDLYYRLNVFPIEIPPLRERAEDIPLLVKHFTRELAKKMGKTITSIAVEDMAIMQQFPWPGNVRELRNVIERSVILTRGQVLNVPTQELMLQSPLLINTPLKSIKPQVEQVEQVNQVKSTPVVIDRQMIVDALINCHGVIAGPNGVANQLGLKRTTLLSRMQKMGLSSQDYRLIS